MWPLYAIASCNRKSPLCDSGVLRGLSFPEGTQSHACLPAFKKHRCPGAQYPQPQGRCGRSTQGGRLSVLDAMLWLPSIRPPALFGGVRLGGRRDPPTVDTEGASSREAQAEETGGGGHAGQAERMSPGLGPSGVAPVPQGLGDPRQVA